MKFSLVVAQGVHAGKKIPVSAASEFLIGREASCQLRPASPSISKQHCGITIRGEQAFVRDCGSTNGTFVNEEQVAGEREVRHGDKLRVGPLEFTISMEGVLAKPAKPASVTETVSAKVSETIIEAKPVAVTAAASHDADDPEQMAALLLGFDDGSASGTPTVENFNPDSTTVMEMPALGAAKPAEPAKKEEKKKSHGDSSSAAAEVLSKYMRRPRT